jgi:hypothetical protein
LASAACVADVRSDPLYVSPLRCGEGEARPEQVEALETRYREAPRDSHQPGHPSQLPRPTCMEALHWGESVFYPILKVRNLGSAKQGEFSAVCLPVTLRSADGVQERSHHVVQGLSLR